MTDSGGVRPMRYIFLHVLRCSSRKCLVWFPVLSVASYMLVFHQFTLYQRTYLPSTENYYKGLALSLQNEPYNINSKLTCEEKQRITVLIIVHSAVSYFDKRNAVRSTWANASLLRHYNMRILFFVGMTTDRDVQHQVEQESLTHQDIVQGKFIDSYRNMTHKGVLWLRWVAEHCPEAEYVLKIDDDVFVNTFLLAETYRTLPGEMTCELLGNGTNKINRGAYDKWKVALESFKEYKFYPMDMCRGYFVHMTSDMVKRMYNVAKETQFFWIDDVYLFGILTAKVNAKQGNFTTHLVNEKNQLIGYNCFQTFHRKCHFIAYLVDSSYIMTQLWNFIQ